MDTETATIESVRPSPGLEGAVLESVRPGAFRRVILRLTMRDRRQNARVSIKALADVAGYHWDRVRRWESGALEPTALDVRDWDAALSRMEQAARERRHG